MSPLQEAQNEYLRVRRALGFALEREGRLLPQFVSFLESQGSDHITEALSLRWAMASPSGSAKRTRARLRMVRGLAKYVAALDARTEVPRLEVLSMPSTGRPTPYIYREFEICALMQAARTGQNLKGETYATLIGLLAATGMRVGEAIALDRNDVDCRNGALIVRQGKFGKSRELLLDPTTASALRGYARERDRVLPHPRSLSFLLSLAGTRLHYKNVHLQFLRLLRLAGLNERHPRPRLHDLRHTFAVTTLMRWYRENVDVEARLPPLSTYLGHLAPSSTYWYLTATPELLQLARQRAEHALEVQP
jgi:integrase